MSTNAAAILRIAEAIPETADNFPLVRELIASLKDLVELARLSAIQDAINAGILPADYLKGVKP